MSEKLSTPPSNVTRLNRTNIKDIPTSLRHLADMIEAGEYTPEVAVVTLGSQGNWPMCFGYGPDNDMLTSDRVIGVLELAKAWFIHYSVERD